MTQETEIIIPEMEKKLHLQLQDITSSITLRYKGENVRFCAHCACMLTQYPADLQQHCNEKHERQNMGFLIHGKEPHRCMYENFNDWLADANLILVVKKDYA